ncbi:hypothetical protein D3C76_1445880 [compost metagenome]
MKRLKATSSSIGDAAISQAYSTARTANSPFGASPSSDMIKAITSAIMLPTGPSLLAEPSQRKANELSTSTAMRKGADSRV